MADPNDTAPSGAGNGHGDDQVAAATSLYEGRLAVESACVALETLTARDIPATKEELTVIHKLLSDAANAFEAAQRRLFKMWGIAIGQA
jgi:hypothetical protein